MEQRSVRNALAPIAAMAAAALMIGPPSLAAQQAGGGQVVVPDSVTPARVLAGSDLFNGRTCAVCHAIAGRGTGRWAPNLSDAEWLHSDGEYGDFNSGIFHTIFWGVKKEEFKARTPRRFAMFPRGGMMDINLEAVKALAAYVWTISHPETNSFVATQGRFLDLVRSGRTDEAVAVFRQARRDFPEHLLLPENGLNRLGYEFMPGQNGAGQPDVALTLFRLNVELHPDAWNVYDSLAEAYMVKGDRKQAIENYQRSLKLNPQNQNAADKLKELQASS